MTETGHVCLGHALTLGVTLTCPVSIRLILDAEQASFSATSSMVSCAWSRSLRNSADNRRRRTVGL